MRVLKEFNLTLAELCAYAATELARERCPESTKHNVSVQIRDNEVHSVRVQLLTDAPAIELPQGE